MRIFLRYRITAKAAKNRKADEEAKANGGECRGRKI